MTLRLRFHERSRLTEVNVILSVWGKNKTGRGYSVMGQVCVCVCTCVMCVCVCHAWACHTCVCVCLSRVCICHVCLSHKRVCVTRVCACVTCVCVIFCLLIVPHVCVCVRVRMCEVLCFNPRSLLRARLQSIEPSASWWCFHFDLRLRP